jgi:hypothetical protein
MEEIRTADLGEEHRHKVDLQVELEGKGLRAVVDRREGRGGRKRSVRKKCSIASLVEVEV